MSESIDSSIRIELRHVYESRSRMQGEQDEDKHQYLPEERMIQNTFPRSPPFRGRSRPLIRLGQESRTLALQRGLHQERRDDR